MTAGSGLFGTARPGNAALVADGKRGIPGEIADLRNDVGKTFAPMAAIGAEEFTNPLAASTTNMMAATASVATERTLLPGAAAQGVLTTETLANLVSAPRQLQFTTGGGTPGHQPATATVWGKDERGKPITVVEELKQTAGVFLSSHFYSDISKIVLSEGGGTGATLAIGLGARIGLHQRARKRAGRVAVLQEVAAGVVVTTGTVQVIEDATAAIVTGTGDLSVSQTITDLDTTTLLFSINGGGTIEVLFDGPSSSSDVAAAVDLAAGVAVATIASNLLRLTSPVTGGIASTIEIVGGTALALLGLTVGKTRGISNGKYGAYTPAASLDGSVDFALYYEYVPGYAA